VCGRAEKDGDTFSLASRCKLYDTVAMSVFVFWKLIKGVLDLRLRFYEFMIRLCALLYLLSGPPWPLEVDLSIDA